MSLFIWRFGRDESRRQLPKGFLPKVTPPQDHKDDFLGDGLGNSIQRGFLGGGERPPLPQSFVNVIQKKFVQHIISNDPWKGVTSTLPVTKPVIAPPGGRPLWAFWGGGVACFQGLCMCPPPLLQGVDVLGSPQFKKALWAAGGDAEPPYQHGAQASCQGVSCCVSCVHEGFVEF